MKIFRPRPFSGADLAAVIKYLRVDVSKALSEFAEALRHLSFADNFDSFTTDVEIAAGATAQISNRLRSKTVKWWAVRIQSGDSRLVEDGEFTNDFVFIKNAGASTVKATLLFMR